MRKRLDKLENPTKAAEAARIKGNEANVQPIDLTWNEQKELKQVNVLYTLLNNRFDRESPLPDSLRFPASNPSHYDTIMAESERAPERGILTKISNKLKGMIRLS